MSYYAAFAKIYDQWSAHMTDDIPWYVELARQTEGPIVELAVGNGRVAVPLAQAVKRPVIGIDRSPLMLEVARDRALSAGVELDLRLDDMRSFELEEEAGLIYCPFRSLLHLATWEEKRRVFDHVAKALRPGGRFAWNTFVFNPYAAAQNNGAHVVLNGIGHTIHHHPQDNRIDLTLDDGESISLWWVTKSEWEGLINVAGLEISALYSGFAREPFAEGAEEFVWVAQKPL